MRGLLIAGTESGVGKTTFSLGLMALLKRKGLSVQAFKVGPDFIDPGLHTLVTGRPSYNLDGWLLPREYVVHSFHRHGLEAEYVIVEGVMGLFDGLRGGGEEGSSAEIAKWLDLPVLLVVDVGGMARSAAALVKGFETFDPALRIAGIVFNRVGGEGHFRSLKEAVENSCRTKVVGYLPWDARLTLPERHLGLITAWEDPFPPGYLHRLADLIQAHVDIQHLFLLEDPTIPAETAQNPGLPPKDFGWSIAPPHPLPLQGKGSGGEVRIGIAYDKAFSFYYPDSLELLQRFGAELLFFSPLADSKLPEGISGLYLGGGYPELYASSLSRNEPLIREIRAFVEGGGPIYAECGGFMYLCREIVDFEGHRHPMVGIFPVTSDLTERRLTLGYREIRVIQDCPLGKVGERSRGHEFHASRLVGSLEGLPYAFELNSGPDRPVRREGYVVRNALGTYVHQHFGSNPTFARNFVKTCLAWNR